MRYWLIVEALRRKVADLAAGAALPSESALCAEFQAARNTVRRALDVLAGEGLIAARPGRGWMVAGAEVAAGPAYRRIAAGLRQRIESGELRPGDAVPSEAQLAEAHGVSRGTARHALAELEGAGLVEAVHGRGRFVKG